MTEEARGEIAEIRERIERYRPIKNLADLADLMREQARLLIMIYEAISSLQAPQPLPLPAPPERPIVELRLPEIARPRLGVPVITMPAPVDLVAGKAVDVGPDEPVRYNLSERGDLIVLYPSDDNICFAPSIFTKPSHCMWLTQGTYFMVVRPKRWEDLYLQSDTSQTKVYISEWMFTR